MVFIWTWVLWDTKGIPSKTKQASNLSVFQPKPCLVRAGCVLEKNLEGFFLWTGFLDEWGMMLHVCGQDAYRF